MNIQKISIDRIKLAGYNPRKNLKPDDPEYEKLKNSIEEFGYVEPLVWNKRTGHIIGGHQRFKVLLQLGYTEVECVVLDLDDTKEKALNIALNKISGEWDLPLLSDLLRSIDETGFDISLTGFDAAELDELFKDGIVENIKEDDYEPVLPETPITQLGDIWQIGKHRLMCGDSTKKEDVVKLMDKHVVRMVFTDPPWNVDFGSDAKHPSWKARTILNDKMSTEKFGVFLMDAFTAMKEVSEPGCMVYVVMSSQEWGNIMNTMKESGYHWSSTIIWAKDSLVLSRKDYHTQFEPIWYGWLDGTRLCPLKDRKQSDVWNIPRPKVSVEHPTMKPIALVAKAIINSSHSKDNVLDLFGGSGSTMIASEQTGRSCFMMELDPKYCDVIVERYANFTKNESDIFLYRGNEKILYQKAKSLLDSEAILSD